MTLNAVLSFIQAVSKEDAETINKAAVERIRWHQRLDNMNAVARLVIGTKVSWRSRRGGIKHGEVLKVNQSTAKIKADDGMTWLVSATLLNVE